VALPHRFDPQIRKQLRRYENIEDERFELELARQLPEELLYICHRPEELHGWSMSGRKLSRS
jgi:hypothetical protein